MTDTEIIETLARRDGWQLVSAYGGAVQWAGKWVEGNPSPVETSTRLPFYLTSHDALRPVLATFSYEEWKRIAISLCGDKDGETCDLETTAAELKYLFTIDPRTLAEKMAEVLKEKDHTI